MISHRTRNILVLILIACTLSLLIFIIVPPASATIEIHQMDSVYIGENCDLSLALTWPDFAVAWCAGDNYCEPPNQIIQIAGFQHNVFIDPEIYHVGTYYRWDGHWNRGENQVAFYVKPGKRPVVNETPMPTPTATPEPGLNEAGNGPFHFMITRGDNPIIQIHYADEAVADSEMHLWLFGVTSKFLDIPLKKSNNTYTWMPNVTETASLEVSDKYKGYLQTSGRNQLQDVFWDNISKCLDTPYDDKIVPDMPVNINNPANIKSSFETLTRSVKYSDDYLIPITMEVKNPDIVIENLVQDDANLWIAGRTTWSEGTTITIKLDPDNYALAQDVRMHTWNVTANGSISGYRRFDMTVPYDRDELYIGIHELKLSVEKNGYVTDMFHNFRVSGIYLTPVPTPEFQKILTDMNGSRITTVPTTVVPTETVPVPTFNVSTNTSIVNMTELAIAKNSTVNGTANGTSGIIIIVNESVPATTKPTPTPTKDPNIHVPLNPVVSVVAVAIVFGLMWRRRKE
jgi:hypothetical protein